MKDVVFCPVCNSRSQRFAFSAPTTRGFDTKLWSVSCCSDCGHQFMNPQPSWDDLQRYYNEQYEPYEATHGQEAADELVLQEARRTNTFRHIQIVSGAKILDVGSGGGMFLRMISKLGAEAYGVEPSEFAAQKTQAQGLNVYNGTLEEFAQANKIRFDVITASHVLEHVPNPVETLRTMKALLGPDGFIWIAVPNGAYPINQLTKGRWHSADLPYHLMQFSPGSLTLAGKNAGLSVRKQVTESLPRAVEASIGLYLRYRWMLPRRVFVRTGLGKPLARWYAARQDARTNGEAIITEFTNKS